MYTIYSCVLFKALGPPLPIAPPDDIDLFNFIEVPTDKKFDSWVDPDSPFGKLEIPKGSRWVYTVHLIEGTDDPECPLKAGWMLGGPFLSIRDAEKLVFHVENQGRFVCVFSALIVADREKLN